MSLWVKQDLKGSIMLFTTVKLFIQVMIKTIRKKQHPVFFHREKKAKFLQG